MLKNKEELLGISSLLGIAGGYLDNSNPVLGGALSGVGTGLSIGMNPALMALTGGLSAPIGAVAGGVLNTVQAIKEEKRQNRISTKNSIQDMYNNIATFNNGGYVGIQTEKGETYASPNNIVNNVNAKTSHKNMSNDKVTDVLPSSSFVFTDNKKFTKSEWSAINDLYGGLFENDLKTMKAGKKYSPADLSKKIDKITKDTPNSFKTDTQKAFVKEAITNPKLDTLKEINERLKIKNTKTNKFADGGIVDPTGLFEYYPEGYTLPDGTVLNYKHLKSIDSDQFYYQQLPGNNTPYNVISQLPVLTPNTGFRTKSDLQTIEENQKSALAINEKRISDYNEQNQKSSSVNKQLDPVLSTKMAADALSTLLSLNQRLTPKQQYDTRYGASLNTEIPKTGIENNILASQSSGNNYLRNNVANTQQLLAGMLANTAQTQKNISDVNIKLNTTAIDLKNKKAEVMQSLLDKAFNYNTEYANLNAVERNTRLEQVANYGQQTASTIAKYAKEQKLSAQEQATLEALMMLMGQNGVEELIKKLNTNNNATSK